MDFFTADTDSFPSVFADFLEPIFLSHYCFCALNLHHKNETNVSAVTYT